MTQFSWPVFFGSLATGLVGVAISVISTIAYNRWAEMRRMRVDCFRQLSRYSASDDEFFRAFSEIPALFYNRARVLAAHEKVIESGNLVGDEMGDFVLAVASDIGFVGPSRKQMLHRFSISKNR